MCEVEEGVVMWSLINVIIKEFANGSVSSLRFGTGYRKNYIQRIKIHSESSNKSIQRIFSLVH